MLLRPPREENEVPEFMPPLASKKAGGWLAAPPEPPKAAALDVGTASKVPPPPPGIPQPKTPVPGPKTPPFPPPLVDLTDDDFWDEDDWDDWGDEFRQKHFWTKSKGWQEIKKSGRTKARKDKENRRKWKRRHGM